MLCYARLMIKLEGSGYMKPVQLSFEATVKAILYNMRVAREEDKWLIPMHFANQLLRVAAPFIAIFLPKLVIDALTVQHIDVNSLMLTLGTICFVLLVVNIM